MPSGRRLIDLEPAGFPRRAGAFLIDVFVAGVVLVALLQLLLEPFRQSLGPAWARVGWFYIAYALLTISLPIWLYFAGYESGPHHATPAKRWLGLDVASTRPAPLSFGRALVRTAAKLLPFEVAHVFLAVPANSFIHPVSGELTLPGLGSLGPSVLGGLLVALLLLGGQLFTVLLHPDGRGIHDLITGTFVVRSAVDADPVPGVGAAPPELGTR